MPAESLSGANSLLFLLAIGGGGGFLSGLLGIGGGIIFVPALYFFLTSTGGGGGHAMHMAVGTSLVLVLATGLASSFWHRRKGGIDPEVLKSWGPMVVCGALAGGFIASGIEGAFLRRFFSAVTLLIAAYIAFSRDPEDGLPHRLPRAVQKGAAAAIGISSALIGIGGAILSIPLMTYTGIPVRKAIGSGSALGALAALPGIAAYILTGLPHTEELPPFSLGYIHLTAVSAIIPAALLLSPFGVRISHRLSRPLLRRIFALVLVLVSIRMYLA